MKAIPNRYTVNTPNGSSIVQVASFDKLVDAFQCAKDQQSLMTVMGITSAVQVFDTWKYEIVGDGTVGDFDSFVKSQSHGGLSPVSAKYL